MRGKGTFSSRDAHLADQPANFQRYSCVDRGSAVISSANTTETGTVPTHHSVRLHNRQRLVGIWRQPIKPNKDRAIHHIEGQSLRKGPSLGVKLMTKERNLSFQLDTRPEQHDQHTDQTSL